MRYLYYLIIMFFTTNTTIAQVCSVGDLHLSTQQQIDDFATTYPNCTTIEGNISIRGEILTTITNLNGLSQIQIIQGNLSIDRNELLVNLQGLHNLTQVTGYLSINACKSLNTLSHLSNLTTVNGVFQIDDYNLFGATAALKSLSGLNQLHTLGGLALVRTSLNDISSLSNITALPQGLYFGANHSITTLNGLHNIETIGTSITIATNHNLEHCSLDALTSIGTFLDISLNTDTKFNLDGLRNLTTIGTYLKIENNNFLADIDGLSQLSSIGGSIIIQSNSNLTSIAGLQGLTTLNGYCEIQYNKLVSLEGMHNIKTINDPIDRGLILTESNLVNLRGLRGLENIAGGGVLIACEKLTDLNGLQQLVSVDGRINIQYVSSLNGLQNLESVGGLALVSTKLVNIQALDALTSSGFLYIYNNDLLQDLTGLEALMTLNNEELDIVDNEQLTSLKGIENIDPNTISKVEIGGNTSLAICEINNICAAINSGKASTAWPVAIRDNSIGCNSNEEILSYCGLNRPEIDLTTSGIHIEAGNIHYPIITDFEDIIINTTAKKVITVKNLGTTTLNLGTLRIANTNDFSITPLGKTTLAANGDATTFTITLNTSTLGLKETIVTLDSNDSDESTFQFKVRAMVIPKNSCLSEGITFRTQEEIDDFSTNYPGCRQIVGNVYIQGENAREIDDLEGLSQLTKIDGFVEINSNADLITLKGLHNLTEIGGSFNLISNQYLTEIESLSKVNFKSNYNNITGSRGLSECSVPSICKLLAEDEGALYLSRNSYTPGCNTVEEILANCESCAISETISTTPTDLAFIEASENITTQGQVNIETGTAVSFKSGSSITLNAGFYAQAGSEFHAYIGDDCIMVTEIQDSDAMVSKKRQVVTEHKEATQLLPSEIKVFPNPVKGKLHIQVDLVLSNAIFYIQNDLGEVIRIGYQLTPTIDVSNLATGIYFVTIITEGTTLVEKFVKVN